MRVPDWTKEQFEDLLKNSSCKKLSKLYGYPAGNLRKLARKYNIKLHCGCVPNVIPEKELRSLVQVGLSLAQLRKHFHVGDGPLYNALRKHNLLDMVCLSRSGKQPSVSVDRLQELVSTTKSYNDIGKELGISGYTVGQLCRRYGIGRGTNSVSQIVNNTIYKQGAREKLKTTIKQQWLDGFYQDRINGMLGVTVRGFCKDPNKFTQNRLFRTKALFYHNSKCALCGKEEPSIHIHHIDEDHSNNLLTNLVPLCNSCYCHIHRNVNSPFVSVTKEFTFDAAHYIPEHTKLCKFLHGHTFKLQVTVRNKVHWDTGFVVDFGVLKQDVEKNVINVFDHSYLNDFITVPTSENMIFVIWELLSLDVKGIQKIRLYETPTSYAEITKEDVLKWVKKCKIESEWIDDTKFLQDRAEIEKLSEISSKIKKGEAINE